MAAVWNGNQELEEAKEREKHQRLLAKWGEVSRAEERDLWAVPPHAIVPPVIR